MSDTTNTTGTASTDNKPTAKGGPPPRWLLKLVTRVHVGLSRLTGARLGNTLGGDEVCFVDMTGARSGRQLTVPLMYVPHGDDVLLVASLGGAPKNPIWYHNIVKNPGIDITYRGVSKSYTARLAQADEKPALWPVCDSCYAPYAHYRKRTTRDIPIFICSQV
jgi:deazaflavin-dependent oxidoreductase (nitroreductase family)